MYQLVRTRHGLFLANPNDFYIGRALIEYGEFSEKEWELLAQLLAPGAHVVEIGANVGAHTVSIAKAVGPSGYVAAIEPQPVVFQNLCANLALNGLMNVQAINAGCASAASELTFPRIDYQKPGNFGAVSLDALPEDPGTPLRVPIRPLDALIDPPALHLIKIDVEGGETDAVQGAEGLIAKHRPILYVENDRVDKSSALIEQIQALDYQAWWHMPFYFNPENYAGKGENIYGATVSVNMFCAPAERAVNAPDLKPVESADWHPFQAEV